MTIGSNTIFMSDRPAAVSGPGRGNGVRLAGPYRALLAVARGPPRARPGCHNSGALASDAEASLTAPRHPAPIRSPPCPVPIHAIPPSPAPPALGKRHACRRWLVVDPTLHLTHRSDGALHVAFTLDACSGATDDRNPLHSHERGDTATIFVTARWILHNKASLALLESRPDLFRIENHARSTFRPSIALSVYVSPRPVHLKPWPRRSRVARPRSWPTATRHPNGSAAHRARTAAPQSRKSSTWAMRLPAIAVNGDGGSAPCPARPGEKRIPTPRNGDDIIASTTPNPPTPPAKGVVRASCAQGPAAPCSNTLTNRRFMAGGMR